MLQQTYGVDLMDIAAGGHMDTNTVNWLADRSMALRETIGSVAMNWLDTARSFVQVIDTSSAIQALRNITSKQEGMWNTNNIHQCRTIEELQTANPVQQRYIMAEPRLRDMFLNNSVEGYGDSYTNFQGDAIGIKQFDYRQVTDGIMLEQPDETFVVNTFYETIPDGDLELTLHQKVDILRNWNMVNVALDAAEMDPTSQVGNML
ncbi:hypothetical protein PHABIO_93 [Pseudomonas phage Phabio]|uniref:Uncharacterized protein n=1 Tax=Pseudomonas phage Phabio TaxID=2006668 RepID=A0A1Y0SVY0_9CAUD|nr:hypothetical protein MZD05_gp093 [Pseudomonas phage Phabio]ARV76724.1 hypothetical protein PHABIO_93 [Pseudomonas phage Phabio]